MVSQKYQGMYANRYDREPTEKVFAELWQEWNENLEDLLPKLLSEFAYVNEDEWEVANTLIQWLGSEEGQIFLIEALSRFPEEERSHFLSRLESVRT